MESKEVFGVTDYAVFVVLLFMSAGIGLYYGCRGGGQRTASEYLMASRDMGVLPICLSMLGSFLSAIALIGIPAEVYLFGASTFLMQIGMIGAIVVSSLFYLPIYYGLQVTSAYEVTFKS